MDGAAAWSLHGSRDFHVRRTARERYGVDDALLGFRGDLAVADLAAIRALAERMNEVRPPEAPGVTAGEIGALGLLHEIGHLLVTRQARPDMTTAMRDVRRARKLVSEAKGGSIPAEATLLLEIAAALALLDLASAIREHDSA